MPFFCPKGGPLRDPYALLDLEHGATDDEIAKSFKKLMLRLHPDKQHPDQSAEESEEVSRKFHDVMDAKSFLLDAEHLAARRAYDSKLVRAKQEAKLACVLQQAAAAPHVAASGPKNNAKNASSKNKAAKGKNDQGSGDLFAAKSSDSKVRPSSYAKKSNVNVKQWGRPRPKNRTATRSGGTRPAVRRASSDGDDRPGSGANNPNNNANKSNGANASDPMRNKTHTRARFQALNDSCGDCSTTDDCSSTSDDEKRRHTYAANVAVHNVNNRGPTSNRPSACKGARQHNKVGPRGEPTASNGGNFSGSDGEGRGRRTAPREARRHSDTEAGNRSRSDLQQQQQQQQRPKAGYRPADAARSADYSNFYPAVDTLEKQYQCPLTKEIMREPMSDFEGNSYERSAILKYLETNSTSPVTGSPLYPMHLTPNSALMEKIRYTLKLKDCIDSLQNSAQHSPPIAEDLAQCPSATPKQQQQQQKSATHQYREVKYDSLPEAVNSFIKDLNTNSSAVTIPPLEGSGGTLFSYLGLRFRLDVPPCVDNDTVTVQTWFDHSRKSTAISSRVVQFNASLHKMGFAGSKLTYRNLNGRYAFTLTKKMDPGRFSKKLLRHGIEYFMEMSIKLHNVINSTDARKVEKVRLTNGNGVATATGQ